MWTEAYLNGIAFARENLRGAVPTSNNAVTG